jgi:hypothetical protein
VNYLLQGLVEGSDRIEPDLGHFLAQETEVAHSTKYTESSKEQTYGQAFNLFSYVVLRDTQVGPGGLAGGDDEPAQPASGDGQPIKAPFESPIQRAIYELATCTDTSLRDYVPHPAYVEDLFQTNGMTLWDNWQGLALHDAVVFVVTEQTPFTLGALAHNVEGDYFPLYLLVLFQKIRMSWMFGEVMRRDRKLQPNLTKARGLWDSFLTFQNNFWFRRCAKITSARWMVTMRPNGVLRLLFYQNLLKLFLRRTLTRSRASARGRSCIGASSRVSMS